MNEVLANGQGAVHVSHHQFGIVVNEPVARFRPPFGAWRLENPSCLLARRTFGAILQNLGRAFGYNVRLMPLAAAGLPNPSSPARPWPCRSSRSSPIPSGWPVPTVSGRAPAVLSKLTGRRRMLLADD